MRRAAKVDENQAGIVKALRAHGWSVLSLAPMGKDCPDLLVGAKGVNMLFEVKDGSKAPSKRKLTEDETRFFGAWGGHRAIVESPGQAVDEVKRHLLEVQGPGWTAEEWRKVAALLFRHGEAPGCGFDVEMRRILQARMQPSDAIRMAKACEAMARALGGGG